MGVVKQITVPLFALPQGVFSTLTLGNISNYSHVGGLSSVFNLAGAYLNRYPSGILGQDFYFVVAWSYLSRHSFLIPVDYGFSILRSYKIGECFAECLILRKSGHLYHF